MTKSLLKDAFDHHIWATLRLIDACLGLTPEQLAMAVPGTYRSVLETMRHIVGCDLFDLFILNGDRALLLDENSMGLPELRAAIARNGAAWSALLEQDLDRDVVVREVDENDGFQRDATIGVRLAGALHHGTDHRTQICTALSLLGIEPPSIDVFTFGVETGLSVEFPPTS